MVRTVSGSVNVSNKKWVFKLRCILVPSAAKLETEAQSKVHLARICKRSEKVIRNDEVRMFSSVQHNDTAFSEVSRDEQCHWFSRMELRHRVCLL